jgi:hypothetical protein
MSESLTTYRRQALEFIKLMKAGYSLELGTPQWASWEAYFLAKLGTLPSEMTNFAAKFTRGVTVPAEWPEIFDSSYSAPADAENISPFMRRRRAAAKCNCPLGREADQGGWLNGLIEFVERNDRLPAGREIAGVQDVGRRSREALMSCEGTQLYKSIANLRVAMMESARQEVFGPRWPK